ncbi:hypothetical protein ACWKWK_00435 [Pseudoxanthomonas beigongshangi]
MGRLFLLARNVGIHQILLGFDHAPFLLDQNAGALGCLGLDEKKLARVQYWNAEVSA